MIMSILDHDACPGQASEPQTASDHFGLHLQYALEMLHCLEVLHNIGLVGTS